MLSNLRTSSSSESARRPRARISHSKPKSTWGFREVSTRSAPARASERTKICPNPRLVPVTTATRPVRSKSLSLTRVSRCENDFHEIGFARVESLEPLRTFFQRNHGGNHRFHANGALRLALDGARIFAGRSARPLQPNLPRDDRLQRNADLGRNISHQDNRAAFSDALDRDTNGVRFSDRFDGYIDTASAG